VTVTLTCWVPGWTGTEDAALVNATILDVSLGGAKLLVDRGFKEGSLISLDLPGGDGPSDVSVLACVVHADQRAGGEWVLGCSFSQELNAADLQRFGIAKAKPQPPDQRGWSRFDCHFHVYYTETNADAAGRKVGTTLDNGTVFRVVSFGPGVTPRNHRTDSIDYAVVIAGEIDMEVDDGASVHLKAGDVLVQRGTIHNWVNKGKEPCVIAFVLIAAKPVTAGGKVLNAHG